MTNTSYQNKPSSSQKRSDTDLSSFVFGKTPPQSSDLEEIVLGAILLDKDAINIVSLILKIESFYSESHQIIYEAILDLLEKSAPIDLLTVTDKIRSNGKLEKIGGSYYLVELTNRVASAANIEYHSRIIQQKWVQRKMIESCSNIIRLAYEDTTDVFDLCDIYQEGAIEITSNITSQAKQMSEFIKDVKHKLTIKGTTGLSGITSGLSELDAITGGWQKQDLVVVAARPSMGKTNLMLKYAMAALKSGKGVLIFSLEMSAIQLLMRLAAAITHIEFSRIKDNKLNERELKEVEDAYDYINSLPIEIDETASLNIYAARAKARAYKKKLASKGIELGLIMSDYLQLYTATLKNKSGNREQEVAAISRGHKSMAKENDVPVIALSQLSRSVETRGGNKKPFLSDLRESGQIEQDADMVQMLYRAEYYNIVEDEDGNSTLGLMEIMIQKHRNGELGDVKVRTMFEYCDIVDNSDLYVNETNPNIITGNRKEPNDDIPF